jgi:hypothetical protein
LTNSPYIITKTPIATATTPVLPATPTLPAAPVAATREAEAEPDLLTPALTSSPSAAALVNVGTVLTHDLLILKLLVAVVDPEDDVKDTADEETLLVAVELVVAVEVEPTMLEEVRAWIVDVEVEVFVELQMARDAW